MESEVRFVVEINSYARDVAGMIGDAFEEGSDFRHRDDEAQVARRRLPERNRVYAETINFDFELIYLVVVSENLFSRRRVTLHERVHRALQRRLRLAAQEQHAVAQSIKLTIKYSVVFHLSNAECGFRIADLKNANECFSFRIPHSAIRNRLIQTS